ncbi:MAG: 16S rRNA (guanine(527)-N(7))-methyltransferase RsmG [Caldiserica bacterium]|nr:16S rRNA (guanine(527)-N(7))-methyltransferase RsmG [Caldisericota bacterium]
MDSGEKTNVAQLLPLVRQSMDDFSALLPAGERRAIVSDAFCTGLTSFLVQLAKANEVMNLTSDADPGHVLTTHVRDSLAPLLVELESPRSLLDIGTGGGFPAVPLALAWPTTAVTMSESIGKKARFLQTLVHSVPLPRGRVVHARVEDRTNALPERAFDMITARGVAHIATILQYALPLLASNGRLVLWKGERDLAELQDPPFAATLHRVHCTATVLDYALPGVERNSKLVILQVTPAPGGRSSRRNGS